MNSDDFEPIGVAAQGVLLRLALGMMANEKDCRPAVQGGETNRAACGAAVTTRAQRNGVESGCVSCRDGTGSPCSTEAAGRGLKGE